MAGSIKLIEPSVERWVQNDMWAHIAKCTRVCYQSRPRNSETENEFCARTLLTNNHYGMLEHGTVYLKLPISEANRYLNNPYSRVSEVISEESNGAKTFYNTFVYVTTNYRVLLENNWISDLQYECEQTEYNDERITLSFIISTGIAREFTRHRKFSFAQESTRYVNYNKKDIEFIIPSWENLNTGQYECIDGEIYGDGYIGNDIFLKSCIESADNYTKLIESGRKPQDAREVLNLATKTQLIMTGFKDDWDHFFELRCASNAHPDAQYIANKAKEEIYGNQGRSN